MHPVVEGIECIKTVLMIVGLKTLITRIRSPENDSRKVAIERVCRDCVKKDDLENLKERGYFALLIPKKLHAEKIPTVSTLVMLCASCSMVENLPLACSRQEPKLLDCT